MNDQEVNKIIAEFMGDKINRVTISDGDNKRYVYEAKYTKSLDALVPVWEKLGKLGYASIDINFLIDGIFFFSSSIWNNDDYIEDPCINSSFHNTRQQAAAHATAKAILKLKNGN